MGIPHTPMRNSPLKQVFESYEQRIQRADDALLESEQPHAGEHCKLCNAGPEVPFSMAFQPIVDVTEGRILAYEALARGMKDEAASTILDHTLHNNRYSIDQRCREKAIAMAAALGVLETTADLSVNFYPNAVYEPKQCLRRTFNAASSVGFPLTRIIFEVTEVEEVRDHAHLKNIMAEYRSHGLRVAIDDFGAGHSGLSLLSVFQPDIIKMDMKLVHLIDERPASRSIVKSIVAVARDLGIDVIAEGVEREKEMQVLCDLDVRWMQGYWFAAPGFESLPVWPAVKV